MGGERNGQTRDTRVKRSCILALLHSSLIALHSTTLDLSVSPLSPLELPRLRNVLVTGQRPLVDIVFGLVAR